MQNRAEIAREWFEKGKHDIEGAKLLFNAEHYTDTIGILIQQAIEKYLKGFLIYHGWKLEKIHDLVRLLAEAVRYRADLGEFEDRCRHISEYYFEGRYPGRMSIQYPREEIKESLEVAETIINRVTEPIKNLNDRKQV